MQLNFVNSKLHYLHNEIEYIYIYNSSSSPAEGTTKNLHHNLTVLKNFKQTKIYQNKQKLEKIVSHLDSFTFLFQHSCIVYRLYTLHFAFAYKCTINTRQKRLFIFVHSLFPSINCYFIFFSFFWLLLCFISLIILYFFLLSFVDIIIFHQSSIVRLNACWECTPRNV